ncbi:MAG: DUF3592 domain-containing protein [Bdellovibrionales bacterium]
MTRGGRKAGVVVEVILILMGLGLIGKGVLEGAHTYKFTHLAESTEGTINGITKFGFGANVLFVLQPEGKSVVFAQDGFFFRAQTGQRVPVLYDPVNPERGMIDRFTSLWFRPFFLMLPGFILLYFGLRLRGERNL